MEYMVSYQLLPLNSQEDTEEESGIAVLEHTKLQKPRMFKVLLHNDDYTTMDFVVHILEKFFKKNQHEAQRVMLEVHTRGIGICGIYTREIAESKTDKVNHYSEEHGHPLKCSFEPCESED
jgi:ATP-dependent Clp protease adaptor protein ClpS